MAVVVKTVLGSHFGWQVNSSPILEPILVVGLVDVLWGYDLDFDPWSYTDLGFLEGGVPGFELKP